MYVGTLQNYVFPCNKGRFRLLLTRCEQGFLQRLSVIIEGPHYLVVECW